MSNEIIQQEDMYLQSVVCTVVAKNPQADIAILYNSIIKMVEVSSFDKAQKILKLIKLNKQAIQ